MDLFPAFEVPDFLEDALAKDDDERFKKSIDFDFWHGDFIRNGKNETVTSGYLKAFNDWIVKALSTERGMSDFYPDYYGADFEEILQMHDKKKQEMAIEKTVTETIFSDELKRAKYINSFKFDWNTDSVEVRFNVFTDEGEIPIIFNIKRR